MPSGFGFLILFYLDNQKNCSSMNQAGKKIKSGGVRSDTVENNRMSTVQSWSLAAPFYRNNSKKKQGEEEVAVEKHLLQHWQKWVLRLPTELGRLPLLLALPGQVQQLGALLGEVFHALVVHGCHRQLGAHLCQQQIACVGVAGTVGDGSCLGHWLP